MPAKIAAGGDEIKDSPKRDIDPIVSANDDPPKSKSKWTTEIVDEFSDDKEGKPNPKYKGMESPKYQELKEAIANKGWFHPKTDNYVYFEGGTSGIASVLISPLGYGNEVKFTYQIVGKESDHPYVDFTQINEQNSVVFDPDSFRLKIIEYESQTVIFV